ncbi:MAG: hypothetical protein GX589_03350 [Deltaproteobacteria bacterium]|nr:hypothetical protein [Deltaproteobacteria bacterium]
MTEWLGTQWHQGRDRTEPERGGVFLEYALALAILIVIFFSVSVWMDLAVNDRVDKAIDSAVEMAPCPEGGVLRSYDACF